MHGAKLDMPCQISTPPLDVVTSRAKTILNTAAHPRWSSKRQPSRDKSCEDDLEPRSQPATVSMVSSSRSGSTSGSQGWFLKIDLALAFAAEEGAAVEVYIQQTKRCMRLQGLQRISYCRQLHENAVEDGLSEDRGGHSVVVGVARCSQVRSVFPGSSAKEDPRTR